MLRFLSNDERRQISESLIRVDSAPTVLDDAVLELASDLSVIHGRIHVANEKHGIHLYMASPACLEMDGAVELDKRHLAVNARKYLAGENMSAQCMKTGTPYSVLDLLSMQPLDRRGYELKPEVIRGGEINYDYLEQDAYGNWIPKPPGDTIPVYQLPLNHPARVYLKSRGFCPYKLYRQFRLEWCENERADGYYRKLIGGFRATPQCRLIFYAFINGVRVGYQSRILEMDEGDSKYFLHPYTRQWVKVLKKNRDFNPTILDKKDPRSKKWIPADERWEGWDPAKYLMAQGARRNEIVMGFDAARQWHVVNNTPFGQRWGVLLEGPLDAGRPGPPAMAILGKSFSPEQATLVSDAFDKIIYIRDADDAGDAAARKVMLQFTAKSRQEDVLVTVTPEGFKDLGEMNEIDSINYINWLRKTKWHF